MHVRLVDKISGMRLYACIISLLHRLVVRMAVEEPQLDVATVNLPNL